MGSASLVFWCRMARSRRSGHQCSLRVILRELSVTAPCMGEEVSVLVTGLAPCGTGHFISFDTFCSLFSLVGKRSHCFGAIFVPRIHQHSIKSRKLNQEAIPALVRVSQPAAFRRRCLSS